MGSQDGLVSGRDRGHQRLGPDDVHDLRQIIGQDRESHPCQVCGCLIVWLWHPSIL